MSISTAKDCEYTITIADLMTQLSQLEHFTISFWINNYEIPEKFDESWDFLFLQESVKISNDDEIKYVHYDVITFIRVEK